MALLAVLPDLPATAQNPAPLAPSEQPAIADPASGPTVRIIPAVSDADIAARLRKVFATTGWFDGLDVRVENGVAFLEGTTVSQDRQSWASDLANRTEGVVATVNRIEVASDADTTFSLAWNDLKGVVGRILAAWPLMLFAALVLILAWLAARAIGALARRAIGHRVSSPLLTSITARAISSAVFLLGLYFVLRVTGLTGLAVTILGGTGLVGIIIGFAFRDIAENFLASMLLSIRNPFRSGDLIEVDGSTGIVQNLNTRSTVLLTLEGTHIQIPNATIYKSRIVNYSTNSRRRAEFIIGIGYDSSTAEAQEIVANVMKDHPAVLDDPEPLVLVDELGAASVNLRVFYWFDTATYSPAKINSAILRLSKNALLRAGIELPDPAREIIFPRGVPIFQVAGAGQQAAPAPSPAEPVPVDTSAATRGEGNLSNETLEVRDRAEGEVPEAAENLLKGSRKP